MAEYRILIKSSAAKEIEAVDAKGERQRIVTRIWALAREPRGQGSEKLAGYADRYRVRHISPDASEPAEQKRNAGIQEQPASSFRALIELPAPYLQTQSKRYRLSPGMQVSAEINLGTRTVLEYLLSPIQKTLHEAGRER